MAGDTRLGPAYVAPFRWSRPPLGCGIRRRVSHVLRLLRGLLEDCAPEARRCGAGPHELTAPPGWVPPLPLPPVLDERWVNALYRGDWWPSQSLSCSNRSTMSVAVSDWPLTPTPMLRRLTVMLVCSSP